LLEYISSIELRRTIQAATNKSEAFNLFVQWVAFGGGRLLAENTRDEQRKMIEYHRLVANLLIFHNVVTMTRALRALIAKGHLQSVPNRTHQSVWPLRSQAGPHAGAIGTNPHLAHAAAIRRPVARED